VFVRRARCVPTRRGRRLPACCRRSPDRSSAEPRIFVRPVAQGLGTRLLTSAQGHAVSRLERRSVRSLDLQAATHPERPVRDHCDLLGQICSIGSPSTW
jgi:hypothetical protein